jgi:hypothetical protein
VTTFIPTVDVAEVKCWGCRKLIVCLPPDEPPVCLSCAKREIDAHAPTRLERLAVALLCKRAEHRHINTRGFDPYSGERWMIDLGPIKLESDTTICLTARLRVFNFFLLDDATCDYRRGFRNPLSRFICWAADALQSDLERRQSAVGEDYPPMSYWE